jgi:CRISPR-associated protein Csx14
MNATKPAIQINVDLTNPGQFFACCGVLELADRLWPGAEGWFGPRRFLITADSGSLAELLKAVSTAMLIQLDPSDDFSSAAMLGPPFHLLLDWWTDDRAGGQTLKVWAGSMRSIRICRAMKSVLGDAAFQTETLFDRVMVVYDPDEPDKKVEPYYFDARRGANARALDIGFMPDALHMMTAAYPAVELLALVGLQRGRPAWTETARVFDYFAWSIPLPVSLLPAATAGFLGHVGATGYRFENAFRTDQKKHKGFLPAVPI